MKIFSCIISLFLVFSLGSCQKKGFPILIEENESQKLILIKDVGIFNGKDNGIIPHQNVWIENGVILKIAETSAVFTTKKAQVIDGKGKILMPGLIDAHVHLSGNGGVPWQKSKTNLSYNLQAYLYAGITTVYDLGGLASTLEKLHKKVEKEKFLGPDIYHTHIPITVKNSHPIPLTEQLLSWPLNRMVNQISPTIDDPSEADQLIKKYLKNDVAYVKVICDQIPPGSPEMSQEQLKAIVSAAHKANKKVIVHIGSPKNAIDAINAGADILAHGVWRGELSPAQADSIAESKIPIIYTLAGFHNVSEIHHGSFCPHELDSILIPANVLKPVVGANGLEVHDQAVMNSFFADVAKHNPFLKTNFKLLIERNAPIHIGTDSNLPGTYAGATYFQELDLLKQYGMSNFELLKAATYSNAHLFLENPDFGEVAEGKKANLLLLNGNPLVNLDWVKSPLLIFKNGKIINRLIPYEASKN